MVQFNSLNIQFPPNIIFFNVNRVILVIVPVGAWGFGITVLIHAPNVPVMFMA